MIILCCVGLVIFVALIAVTAIAIDDDTLFTVCLLLEAILIVLSMAIGDEIRKDEIEKTMAHHDIIEYKVDKNKDMYIILSDSSKFNKDLYNGVIKKGEFK
jgi:hypothetical protein